MTGLSSVLVSFTLAFLACDGAFLEHSRSQHLGAADTKPDEKKKSEADPKADKEKKSKCPEADPLTKEIEEMKANDPKFLEKTQKLAAAVDKCEKKKAEAAKEKADAVVAKKWTESDLQKLHVAVTKDPATTDPATTDTAKKDEHKGAFAACREEDALQKEVDEMPVTDDQGSSESYVKKRVELTELINKCRAEKAKPIIAKAEKETEERYAESNMTPSTGSFVNASALNFGNEQMNVQAQQFMKVDLGPFASAAEACDYCFGSFTKAGQAPAGPVAPFCVCMAYPKGGKHNMFCATPPSSADYIQKKNGCRCKAKDMEAMGETTCKPI